MGNDLSLDAIQSNELLNSVPCGIAVYKMGQTVETLYYNEGVCMLSGHNHEEYEQLTRKNAMNIVYEEDQPLLAAELASAITNRRTIDFSYRICHRNGGVVWVHLSAALIRTEDGYPIYHAVFMDINDEREIQKTLRDRAERDSLTNLFNRVGLERKIEKHFSKDQDTVSAFIMVDVDNFKQINDIFGHTKGDEALCEIGNLLVQTFKMKNVVARMGGDEFAVFLFAIPSIEALKAEIGQFCTAANRDYDYENKKVHVSCSVGAAVSPKDGSDFHTLYANADKALLSAKNNGKNQYHLFESTMIVPHPALLQNMEWLLDETSNGIYICNANTYELLYLNRRGRKMVGLPDDESYVGAKCHEVLMGQKEPCPFCKMNQMTATQFYEREFVKQDTGSCLLLKGKMIDWNGIKAHVEFITDDTQRALVRLELQKAATHLQKLMDCIPGGIGIFEVTKGKITVSYLNEGFYKLIGCPYEKRAPYLGLTAPALVHPEDMAGLRQEMQRALAQNDQFDYTYRIMRYDGTYHWINLRAAIIERVQKKVILYGSYSDVDQLKASELDAKFQKEKFDIALANTDMCVWEMDVPSKTIIQTENAWRIYGMEQTIANVPESLIERGCVASESIADFRKLYEKVAAGERIASCDIHWLDYGKDTDWWARITYTSIFDEQGKPMKAIGFSENVTTQRLAQKRYEEAALHDTL